MLNEIGHRNLRRFCDTAGFDFNLLAGADPYSFEAGGREWTGEAPAFAIRRSGRFGNNIRQIIHATQVAAAIGVERLYINEVNVGALAAGWRMAGISFLPFGPPPDEAVLRGTFFYRAPFRHLFRDFDGTDQLRIVSGIIAPMLRHRWGEGRGRAANVLHIHIRSGDIFTDAGGHRAYVQPPLAYYRQVLSHFQQTHRAPNVVLVFEDRRNPCVDALCDTLDKAGIAHFVLCGDFEDAVGELLSATSLAMGFGTFAPMIALASTRLRRIYAFRRVSDRQSFAAKGTEIFVGRDTRDYIAPDTWRNSPDQRRRMIEYPDGAVQIV
jgi:hypothetical protein